MNRNRVFLALTAGLLAVPESRVAGAWDQAGTYCLLDVTDVKTGTGAVVQDGCGQKTPLKEWIERRRAEGVVAVHIATLPVALPAAERHDGRAAADRDGLERAPDLMARFSGNVPMVLSLQTCCERTVYKQGAHTGPRLTLAPSLIPGLLDRQAHPEFYWPIVLAEINQFRSAHGQDEIEIAALRTHMSSDEGAGDWEAVGEQIFREIQVEALVFDEPFVIPDKLASFVKAVEPPFKGARAYWALDVMGDSVSGAQLLRLVEAQGSCERMWQIVSDKQALRRLLHNKFRLDDFPEIAPAEWPDYLAQLSSDDSWRVRDELVESVRLECERMQVRPVIPHDLVEVFGPDEEEQRRRYFRLRVQMDFGWEIRKKEPWMFYVLEQLDSTVAVDIPPPLSQARHEFIVALQAIRDFCRSADSPYVIAFEFALHLAAHAQGNVAPDLDALARNNPERPDHTWPLVSQFIATFALCGWGADRLLGLAAISAADVSDGIGAEIFGGLGAWQYQEFDDDDDARLRIVSGQLFAASNRYFDALVSVEV